MAITAFIKERYTGKNGGIKGYQVVDMKGNILNVTSAELKDKVANGIIHLINFTYTSDGKLVYKSYNFDTNVKRNECIILEASDDSIDHVGSYMIVSLKDGSERLVSEYELFQLVSSGKLIPKNLDQLFIKSYEGMNIRQYTNDGRVYTGVFRYLDTNYFKNLKSVKAIEQELLNHMKDCPKIEFLNFTENYKILVGLGGNNIKKIVTNNDFNGKELPDDKFWAIVEKNRSIIKEPITSVNAISIGAKLEYNLSNVIGPKMTDQQVCDLYASVTKYEMLAYNAACEGDKRFGQAIPYSDDRFREIVCNLIWMYGEKVYKEFLSDPVGAVRKYHMPIEKISYIYIFGY